jgi:multidrug resistance efflux pump
LLAALFALFEILAGLAAYGSTVVGDVGAGPLLVWVLRSLAFAFFLLGVWAAAFVVLAELEPSSRGQKIVRLAMTLPLIVVVAAAGAYIGGWILAPASSNGSTSDHFASQLTHVFSGLSRERDKGLLRLDNANTRQEQLSATTTLAAAFSEKEGTVLRMIAPPEELSSKRQIAAGLHLVSAAYAELEGAVGRNGSQMELDRARAEVNRAERRLRESQMRLAGYGYLIVVPE